MEKQLFYVSVKQGEFDFGVNAQIEDLTDEQYNKLKSMLITGIGAMERMRNNKASINHMMAIGGLHSIKIPDYKKAFNEVVETISYKRTMSLMYDAMPDIIKIKQKYNLGDEYENKNNRH